MRIAKVIHHDETPFLEAFYGRPYVLESERSHVADPPTLRPTTPLFVGYVDTDAIGVYHPGSDRTPTPFVKKR